MSLDTDALIDRRRIGLPIEIHRTEGSPLAGAREAVAAARDDLYAAVVGETRARVGAGEVHCLGGCDAGRQQDGGEGERGKAHQHGPDHSRTRAQPANVE